MRTAASNCSTINFPAGTLGGKEDCLKLNIWVGNPLPSRPAPVIVWLHTGAFFGASASFPGHNGRRLVEETGVIVVAPQYRLGPFGFLVHAALAAEDTTRGVSGNYGLLDQRFALQWVRDNIAQFGGDPDDVTIAGTSAGGESVGLQLVSPGSAGLFQRAIVQSGSVTTRWPMAEELTAQGAAFADALGCVDPSTVTDCMRSKTKDQILFALPQATQQVVGPPGRVYWTPVVDGVEIPDQPRWLFEAGLFSRVPTIVGSNRDEGAGAFIRRSFPSGVTATQYEDWVAGEFGPAAPAVLSMYPATGSPEDAMAAVLGDGHFVCEGQRLARMIANAQVPAYLYSYEYLIDDLSPGRVIHGGEGNIIFGNDFVPPLFSSHTLTAADNDLHHAMAGYWTRFARTGRPNADEGDVADWPVFKSPIGDGRGADRFLILDGPIAAGKRLREEQCAFWEPYFFRSMIGKLPAGG